MKEWDALIYGDINVDVVVPGVGEMPKDGEEMVIPQMETYVGGGAALFAMGLGKLGIHAAFKGKIGDDCYGDFIQKEMANLKLDTSLLEISSDNKTGISISFTNEKDRCFVTYRGTNDEINLENIKENELRKTGHIHVTGYQGSSNHEQYLKVLQNIHNIGGITVSFDVGWDDTGEWKEEILDLLPYINVLFMNETEILHYSRESTVELAMEKFSRQCELVVVKMGSQGSMARSGDSVYQAAAFQVIAVDTTGAGDSFNAGYIYGYLKKESINKCLEFSNGCGALSVTKLGGNTGFPTEMQLLAFIREQKESGVL